MKMHIKEFSELSGVSVRTLHYYDEIGLLKPCFVDEQNGYRFYDEQSLIRMQEILFYRELDFSLKSIIEILSSSNYDKQKALCEQRKLLILKKQRLERLIDALEDAGKGKTMSMDVFNNAEYEAARKNYEAEAKEKWGSTDAYREFEKKTCGYTADEWDTVNAGMNGIFAEFGEYMLLGALWDDPRVSSLVKKLQQYITDNFYFCTDEILSGLGVMYTADERFKKNIDKHGENLAEFIATAIQNYCKAK